MLAHLRRYASRRHLQRDPAAPGSTQRGFTMMEVLMTMLLLTIVMVGLAALQIATIRQVTLTRRANGALRLGQGIVERFQTLSFIDLPSTTSPTWEPVFKRDGSTPMQNVAEDGESSGPFTVNQLVEIATNGDRLVTVRVQWTDLMPGATASAGRKYRILESLLTLRRSDL